jgi:hypothetical protein
MRRWILRAIPLAIILVGSGAVSPALAAHLVTFTRGQAIVVQSFEKRGTWYYFILDGGGEMGVQANQVVRIEEYEVPPPSALPPAPAPAMPAPAPEVVQSGVNPGGPESGSAAPAVAPDPQQDESAANVMSRGNDQRFRAARSGGPSMQPGVGGTRKPPGMGAGAGVGRINPYNRRTQPPPPQTGTPTQ